MSDEGYEKLYIKEAFDTNWIAPLGKNVDLFEEELCEFVKIKKGLALNSGTAAIHLALKAANIRKGDYVICSTFTFAATVNPIVYEGAKPIFIDSDIKTWNMCPIQLKRALQSNPNVKAVIVVHLYGLSADMDEIVKICKEHNVTLIEDAAESLGSLYKSKQTGTFGEFGIFSFNGNKIITTSGGGMLVSNNEERIEKARFWATQSRDNALHYEHSEIGYNYRLSNVSAGIGRGQLKVLNERIKRKKEIYNLYVSNLTAYSDDVSFMPENDFDDPNYWLSCIVFKSSEIRNSVIKNLTTNNIESRPLWKPMHLQPIFMQYDYFGENISENLFIHGLCLPSDTKISNQDINLICEIIVNTIEKMKVNK